MKGKMVIAPDWKARCAEHCGTIGKRDATIAELEAELENYKTDAYVLSLLTKLDELFNTNNRNVKLYLKAEKQLESSRVLIALYFEGCDADTFDDAVRLLQTQIGEKDNG